MANDLQGVSFLKMCSKNKVYRSWVVSNRSPIAHYAKSYQSILFPFKDQLPDTLSVIICLYFSFSSTYVYRHWICTTTTTTTTTTATCFDTQTLSQRQTIIWNRCESTTTQPPPWRELAGTGCRRRPRWTWSTVSRKLIFNRYLALDILHDLLRLLLISCCFWLLCGWFLHLYICIWFDGHFNLDLFSKRRFGQIPHGRFTQVWLILKLWWYWSHFKVYLTCDMFRQT